MNELVNLNQIVSEIKFFENQAVTSYWEIGKRLAQAKEQVPHGEWMNWVDANLGYSERTTQQLIKVANSFSNPNTYSDLSFNKVLALTSIKDEEERQEFTESHPVEDMTVRELKAEIKEYKKNLEETVKEKDEEIGKLRVSNNSLYGQLQIEKSRSPEVIEKEVIKEIVPDDYELTKAQLRKAEEKLQKQIDINESLKLEKKEALSKLQQEEIDKKIISDFTSFHYKIVGFIKDVGGLLYLTEYIDQVPKNYQDLFMQSATHLKDFGNQLHYNVEKELGDINDR